MKTTSPNTRLLLPFLLVTLLACTGPSHDEIEPDPGHKGIVSGRATDALGKPLANASIVVNNTQFFNHNILGQTDATGKYSLSLTPGSWYVQGTTKVRFDDKNYVLDLHPDSDAAFAGTQGAVRNLSLKIAGERTGEFGNEGYYGGQVEVFAWGLTTEQITLNLQPVGTLLDGTSGKTIRSNPSKGYVDDVPLGKYIVTARMGSQPLLVRIRNAEQPYAKSVSGSFDPSYAGAVGRYKLNVEVSE